MWTTSCVQDPFLCPLHQRTYLVYTSRWGQGWRTHQPTRRRKRGRAPSLGWEDPLEEHRATHSSILAWGIPWTEEPGRLWSIRLPRAGQNWSDLAHTYLSVEILLFSLFLFYWWRNGGLERKLPNVAGSKWKYLGFEHIWFYSTSFP